MFDYAVIGKGLIGSAAARYLTETGQKVALIGPDEPQDWAQHQGVFASHYDQGRITRVLDEDIIWATLAKRSIEQYKKIEETSGITFHFPVGGLQVNPESGGEMSWLETIGQQFEVNARKYAQAELSHNFPYFYFPDGMVGILEPEPAGYINPRTLIAAQLKIAGQKDISIIREQAVAIKKQKTSIEIRTTAGHSYSARKLLISTGAYVNQFLEPNLDLELRARTILLAELSGLELERLRTMPTLIYRLLASDSPIDSIYMAPPTRYPDGKYYIKIGASGDPFVILESFGALGDWFRSGGNHAEAEALKEILLTLMPQLNVTAFHHKPCVTTYMSSHHPVIDSIEPNYIFVAGVGGGSSAKSSNEIGRIAALLVEHGSWHYDLDPNTFKAIYKEHL